MSAADEPAASEVAAEELGLLDPGPASVELALELIGGAAEPGLDIIGDAVVGIIDDDIPDMPDIDVPATVEDEPDAVGVELPHADRLSTPAVRRTRVDLPVHFTVPTVAAVATCRWRCQKCRIHLPRCAPVCGSGPEAPVGGGRRSVVLMKVVSCPVDPAVDRFARDVVGWSSAAGAPAASNLVPIALARACFAGAPRLLRPLLIIGWKLLLLDGPAVSDADRVLGWPVVQVVPVAVLQRRSGWGIEATLAFAVSDGWVSFSSGMVFSRPAGRAVWRVMAPIHRWVVPIVLGHAVAR